MAERPADGRGSRAAALDRAEVSDRVRGLRTGGRVRGKHYDVGARGRRARELLPRRRGAGRAATVIVVDDSRTLRERMRDGWKRRQWCEAATVRTACRGPRMRSQAAVMVDARGRHRRAHGGAAPRLDAALRRTPCLLLTASEEKDAERARSTRSGRLHAQEEEMR